MGRERKSPRPLATVRIALISTLQRVRPSAPKRTLGWRRECLSTITDDGLRTCDDNEGSRKRRGPAASRGTAQRGDDVFVGGLKRKGTSVVPDYPITEKLHRYAAIHCATLVLTQDVITGPGWPHAAQPDAALRNGTLTFVKSGGRTYGITCQHVVQHYRDVVASSGDKNSHSMRTMLNGFYVVMDRFVQPQASLGEPDVDVAIRELNPAHIVKLGKEAMDLDEMAEPTEDMRHAYAVGFPERLAALATRDMAA